jgi:mono/diheme cytochrome c family protein
MERTRNRAANGRRARGGGMQGRGQGRGTEKGRRENVEYVREPVVVHTARKTKLSDIFEYL